MPFNPTTGVFTRVDNTFSEPVTGTLIDPLDADGLFDDYDAGLTLSHTFTQTGTGAVPLAITALFQGKYYTPFMFGAVGDGVTDDTAAIQRTIDELPIGGGVVEFPQGITFLCAGSVTISTRNVILRGFGSKDDGVSNASTIVFSGTGARFIDARDSFGFSIEGIRIRYSSASFTGSLVDISAVTPGVTISAWTIIRNCFLEPDTDRTGTAVLLNLGGTVDALVEKNFFTHGACAIKGQEIIGQNVRTTLRENTFAKSEDYPVLYGGESWVLIGNTFERNSAGVGKAFSNSVGLYCIGMSWIGNWFGDVSAVGTNWIDGYFQGLTFEGNQVAGYSTINGVGLTLRGSTGVEIGGNYFQYLTNAVDAATASTGLKMGQNAYLNVTTPVANASNVLADDFTLASTGITSISPKAVTFAKIQDLPTATLIGNPTGGTAASQSINIASALVLSGSSLGTAAMTGDITSSAGSFATTLATVNSNVGTFGSATQSVQFTVNAKGLMTAAANVTITPAIGSITGLGTGVATALALNVGSAGAPVTFNGALGTPSSGVGTNLTGTASSLTAGHVTTNANLTGDVTSVGNATTLAAGNAGNLNSGTLLAARMPAHTGDVTSSAGSVALTLVAGNAGNLNSGTLLAARMPALTGDITTSAGAVATTLATVNANVGTFGSATQASQVTVNAKGLVTAAANVTVTPAVGSISGLGSGVATALALAANAAGGFVTSRLSSKVLSTTYDLSTASGTQDITGAGFQPTSVILLSAVGGGNFAMSFGIIDSATGQDSLKIFSDALIPAPQASAAIIYQNSAATASQTGVVSYLSDGIRITWTKVGSPTGTLTIYALCFR